MPSSPFARVDHLVIAVRDLDASAAAYAAMLGLAPSWRGTHPAYGTANVLFGLANCYVELLALAPGNAPQTAHPLAAALAAYLEGRADGLFALALGSDDLAATAARLRERGLTPGPLVDGQAEDDHGTTRHWRSFFLDRGETRGLSVFAIEHRDRSDITASVPTGEPSSIATAVDHVVIFSDDLAGALRLWCETFGVPERWRHEFPERGTVNVGLRLGGVTLELVAPLANSRGESGERAWGLAYAVGDVDAAVARLRAHSVAVSDGRTGLAPGTRVCTVKWADRIPTLLIEHSERERSGTRP
jgi:catechol 2,3-dioxygenase-like lactoylglutathione lyase family enzyme